MKIPEGLRKPSNNHNRNSGLTGTNPHMERNLAHVATSD